MMRLLCVLIALGAAWPASAAPPAEHVVVIGLDGCRPEAIGQAAGPVLRELWHSGAWCFSATASLPSVTQVNFASILTSSTPEHHGIATKDWVQGARPKVAVPTVFEVMEGAGLSAAGFLGHEKLYPSEPDPAASHPRIHIEHSPYQAREVAPIAAKYLTTAKPSFCFIYMGDLDGAGHKHGWLSAEQLGCLKDIDAALGVIVTALKDSGLWARTLLIITADHGGHGKSHSAGTPEDVTVPWIAAGPLVKAGELRTPVRNLDTSATAAAALGVARPKEWDGQPVPGIFAER